MPLFDASKLPDAVNGSRDTTPAAPIPLDVSSYALSPDGAYAALVARDPETPGERRQKADKADAVLVDHDLHGSRAYLLDLRTDKLTPVAVPPDVGAVMWSHKADRFVAISGPMNNASDLMPADTAWLVAANAPARPTRIATLPLTVESVVWSGDDTKIFFTAQSEADAPPGVADLFVLSFSDEKIVNFSKRYRGTFTSVDVGDGDGAIAGSVVGTTGGYVRVDGRAASLTAIDLGGDVTQLATNDRHSGWMFVRSSGDEPAALYYTAALDKPATRLTLPPTAGDWRAVKARVVHWKSDVAYDRRIAVPPAGRRDDDAYRSSSTSTAGRPARGATATRPLTQFLVGHGWAVLQPNPRGSTGHGAAFASANKNDLGGGDYRDIMAGVDYAIAVDSIDASHLALIGYSYGGEMAGFVEGKTDRFKAIVSGAPVIDQFSEYGTKTAHGTIDGISASHGSSIEDAWRQSPLSGVSHAKTPFLLLQGESVRPIRRASRSRCIARSGRPACRSSSCSIRETTMVRCPQGH